LSPAKILVAPDSFKGSLSAMKAAELIAAGWQSVRPSDEVVLLPQADGGEGTIEAIEAAIPGSLRHSAGSVTGPDGRPTAGWWLELPNGAAVVELAISSGLPLMEALDPLGATTRGLGEVVRSALDAGARSILIGLGGSASTDGGSGALSALGLRLLDANGEQLEDGGEPLARLSSIDSSELTPPPAGGVVLLTDVTSPLTGATGAAKVFGPQKGAAPAQVAILDSALAHFADVVGCDPTIIGSGAAGGAAFGFTALWGARIESGADYLADLSGLDEHLATADILLTGEGRFDAQSLSGKVVGALLERARQYDVIAGVIAGQVTTRAPVWSLSLTDLAGSSDAAMASPERWLLKAGAHCAVALCASRNW
jgi:glycerate kinase